jgi:hypothetical protein
LSGWRLVFLLASLGGEGLALSAEVTMAGVLAFSLLQRDEESARFAAWSAASSLGIVIALLPGTYWGVRSLLGKSESPVFAMPSLWRLAWITLPLGLLLGWLSFRQDGLTLGLTLAPFAHLLTSLSAVVLLLALVSRGGPPVPWRRIVAALTAGLTATPLMAIVAEVGVLLPLVVGAGVILMTSPEGPALARSLLETGGDPSTLDPAVIAAWLAHPAVVASLFAFIAGIVPCLEEIAKSAAVWRFLRRGLSASEAFLFGAVAGAGYGLFEALFLSQPGADWLGTAFGRLGASAMHAATAGLTSWGLMEWARERRWRRALGMYAVGVLAHATWNSAALTTGYTELLRAAATSPSPSAAVMDVAANLVLVALSLGAVALLVFWRPSSPVASSPVPLEEVDVGAG